MLKLVVFSLMIVLINIKSFSQDEKNFNTNNIQVSFPFSDNAENSTTSYSYWDRDTVVWEVKTANSHSGSKVWAMNPTTGSYNYITLKTPIDLSSTANPYFALWSRKADGGTGALSIEVSTDGGTSWPAISQPSYNGAQYSHFEISLNNYKVANVLLRIGCYAPYGGTYYIDDILIDNAPSPTSVSLLTPTNNGMKVKWGQSSATDFYQYRVILSTDQNVINNYFAPTGITGHGETKSFDIFNKATIETTLTDLIFTNTQYYAKIYEQDTQDLFNQGSDRADLVSSFNLTVETSPFTETFEGTYKWAADIPWAVTTDDVSDPDHSPTHAYEDSPGENQ
ncbi:MAG: hypothetical protein ABI550_04565, partial [Ignavibacteriaceae bacterium]